MNQRKTFIILILATLLSATGVYFAHNYIQQEISLYKAPVKSVQPQIPMVELVGISKRHTPGTVIDNTMIGALKVPADIAAQHDYVPWDDRDSVLGARLLVTLPSTAAIRYSDVAQADFLLFSDQLQPGERAMTIAADAFHTIFGYLQPGDHIDILLVTNGKQNKTIPLLSNIEVLASDALLAPDLTKAGTPNTGETNTLTVKVTQTQAQTLSLGLTQGKLVVLLRNRNDTALDDKLTMSQNSLFPVKKSVQLIIGGKK